ncbi:hypothetical protein [Allobranchiibius sp. GilTou38]|uniref:hypothetical protein n=1 Tax=Allobranchiibius sp. GilTou38 TaxID=2815210 RepID=UPI001AA0EA31|nr:hypothetical protein [Allobranchiibius sp. GilTou38]MBO1766952.1 hypothetical protein [Allobranchiibius sp. GilTou38]
MSMSPQAAVPLRAPRARVPHPTPGSKSRSLPTSGASSVRLRVVAPADSRDGHSAAFIAACVFVLAMGLATLLVLNTQRAQQSFTMDSLQARSATYTDTQQSLRSALQLAESPASLASRAHAMGLAPASRVRYVGSDGKTIGVANGAAGSTPFTVGPLTTGGAAKVAGTAATGASLGAGVGAPAPKKATKTAKTGTTKSTKDSPKSKGKSTKSKSSTTGTKTKTKNTTGTHATTTR